METLIAFHGKQEVKDKYLSRVRQHRKMDHLVQGVTWENGKGCAIGCTLEGYNHSSYEKELGIPIMLAKLEDRIFEGLPNEYAMKWPELFLKNIKPGANLDLVGVKIMLWLLVDETHGVRKYRDTQGKTALDMVADVLGNWIKDGRPNEAAAGAAEATAWAAEATAWAAAEKNLYIALAEQMIRELRLA